MRPKIRNARECLSDCPRIILAYTSNIQNANASIKVVALYVPRSLIFNEDIQKRHQWHSYQK